MCGCKVKTAYKTEIIEVYRVKGTADSYEAGNMIFRDSVVYQSEKIPRKKYVFNQQLTIKGQDIYPDIDIPGEYESEYSSVNGEKLSYYKYFYNSKMLKERSEAYDASNDELLRYEEMSYDKNGRLDTRKIFTSNGELATSYSFIYDAFGNEIKKITQHLIRDLIVTEESRITKYYEDKTWKEKWEFVEDEPITYYKRTVKVH
tara:strand:- start:1897 stop:2505 length:609 start_codon:yes stop_codon:yes gene_type:complete